jgi:acetolactate synthase-1/2/3 large subunit
MRLSDYIISFLLDNYNIDTYFLVSGGGCIFLVDSIGSNNKVKYIATHHEQVAAIAAEGYARLNNRLGTCVVTSGPGGTNAITGVLGAWLDSIPLIIISGQVNRQMTTNYTGLNLRQLGDQEFDIVQSVKNMTKYSVQINDPQSIKYHLEKACKLALSGRPGPVWLDIPLDVQSTDINPDSLQGYDEELPDYSPEVNLIETVYDKLRTSSKPLLVVGNGIRLSGGIDNLYKLINELQIPVISAVNGNDIVNSNYKYYCGRFGTHAQICANNLLNECDLLLSIGSRLYIRQIGYDYKNFAQNAYKIYVDIDENELNKPTLFPDLKIHSDANLFLKELIKYPIKLIDNSWAEYCYNKYKTTERVLPKHRNNKSFISHYSFMEKLSEKIPSDYNIVTSDGSANVVAMQVMDLKDKQRLITNTGSAPMGYGLPCAIGASVNSKIVCIEGDGSLHLNLNALETLKHYDLPIKVILLNNNGYLSIKLTQKAFFNGRLVASDPSSGVTFPNFKDIIKAYNIKYYSIKNNDEIDSVLEQLFNDDSQCVCEVFTDPNEYHEPKVFTELDCNGKFIPGKLHNIRWND